MAPVRSRFRNDDPSKNVARNFRTSEKCQESIDQHCDENDPWAPSVKTAFKAFLSARLCSAVWSGISDCDETYNYWEPTHFLLYSEGFQTWEYSPAYALRSYAYLWFQALPGYIYCLLFWSNKILVFYFIRCTLAAISALCEAYFYRGVCWAFGSHIGRLVLALLIFSSGMFVASCAYLPSTFAMNTVMLMFGAWFQYKNQFTILSAAFSTLVGWPFSVLLGVPVAFHIVVFQRKLASFLKWSIISLFSILVPLVLIDSHYYGRLVVAPLNIVLYNVFSDHGPNLYGTEPWTFYFVNAFLNFNFVFLLALLGAPLMVFYMMSVSKACVSSLYCLTLSSLYLWIAVFFTRPHKEERFLFPVYPLFCLSGALSINIIQRLTVWVWQFIWKKPLKFESTHKLGWILVIISSVISVSRSIALYKGYHASLDLFLELSTVSQQQQHLGHLQPNGNVHLCMGKEWHRFPSHFFVPQGWELQFIRSEFKGQLPKHFNNSSDATSIVPEHMNDLNKEETSRYVDVSSCDYMVDGDYPDDRSSIWEPQYSRKRDHWKIIASLPLLDPSRSPRLLRAFYVPLLYEKYCTFIPYNLLQRAEK